MDHAVFKPGSTRRPKGQSPLPASPTIGRPARLHCPLEAIHRDVKVCPYSNKMSISIGKAAEIWILIDSFGALELL
jgi:hypothetical protein